MNLWIIVLKRVTHRILLVGFAHMQKIKGRGRKVFWDKKSMLANNFRIAANFFLTIDKYGDVVRK